MFQTPNDNEEKAVFSNYNRETNSSVSRETLTIDSPKFNKVFESVFSDEMKLKYSKLREVYYWNKRQRNKRRKYSKKWTKKRSGSMEQIPHSAFER